MSEFQHFVDINEQGTDKEKSKDSTMSSVKSTKVSPLKMSENVELSEPLTPRGDAKADENVDFVQSDKGQQSSDNDNSQSATPQPYEVPEMNNEENSTIIHKTTTLTETEENKMPHPRKDSLAIPHNASFSMHSIADSDDNNGAGDTKKHKSKHRDRCPSQSIGQMSQIRTTRHSVKVKSEMSFIANVMRCCVAENGFDLYQVIAFDADTKETWKDWIFYIFHVLKAVLCALTQIFGMIIIMIDVWTRGLEEKGSLCNATDFSEIHTDPAGFFMEQNLKILAFLFSSFLAYFSVDMLFGVEKGMYQDMKYAENVPFIATFWLQAGFTVNVIVSIVAVYGSFVVIFFSDNSLDMVLNSVALFFIVELDDLLVDDNDYERIGDYIEEYVKNEFKGSPTVEKMNSLRTKTAKCKKACRCCFDATVTVLSWMYRLPFQILRYVTIFACIVMPFYVGWCY